MNLRARICSVALSVLLSGCTTDGTDRGEGVAPSPIVESPKSSDVTAPAPTPEADDTAPVAAPVAGSGKEGPPPGMVVNEGWSGIKSGFIKIFGEIKNESKDWILAPGIEVELYDADGKPLAVTSIVTETRKELGMAPRDGQPAQRTLLPPGEVAVFGYTRDLKKVSGTYASHKLFPTGRVLDFPQPEMLLEKRAIDTVDEGTYLITGKITNKGAVGCRSPTAVAGFYTAEGKVRLVVTETPEELFQKMLGPGKSIDFELKKHTFEVAAEIADVKLWADCHPEW